MKKKIEKSEDIKLAIKKISEQIDLKPNIELFYERAQLFIKDSQNAKAINDYNQIIKLDSTQHQAKSQIEYLTTILRFNNIDIYASPNTNFDPWLE